MPYKDKERERKHRAEYRLVHKQHKAEYDAKYAFVNKDKIKERLVNNKDIISKRKHLYDEKNKEHIRLYNAKYILEHKEEISKQLKIYRLTHKKEINLYMKQYHQTDSGKTAMLNSKHKRRSVLKTTDITIQWLKNLKDSSIICCLCGNEMNEIINDPRKKSLDHIIPLNKRCNGTHTMDNVRYICMKCNLERPKDGSDLKELSLIAK